MREMALLFGALLTGLGLWGYFGSDSGKDNSEKVASQSENVGEDNAIATREPASGRSKTALIPAFFGLPLMLCGTLAWLNDNVRKHAMHAAAGIAALGAVLALGRGLMKVQNLWSDDATAQRATTMVLLMGSLCLAYVLLSANSFLKARAQNKSTG